MITPARGWRPEQRAFAVQRLNRLAFTVAAFLVTLANSASGAPRASAAAPGEARQIDTQRSTLTINVFKTGLFAAFAHNHEIRAPIREGSLDEQAHTVELAVDARRLRVLDPGVSSSDREQVQTNMLGPKVLDSEKFPEIKFRSTSLEPAGEGKWTVHGDLTLHGETHPVKVLVEGQNGHYRGSAQLRQTDFGITPISIAGGSVKVKDEVRVEFEIFAANAR